MLRVNRASLVDHPSVLLVISARLDKVTYQVFISAKLDKIDTFAIEQEMDLTKRKKMPRTLSFGLIYTFMHYLC